MGLEELPADQKDILSKNLFPIGEIRPNSRFRWRLITIWTLIPWTTSALILVLTGFYLRYLYPLNTQLLAIFVAVAGLIIPTLQMRRADNMVTRFWALYGLFIVGVASIGGGYLGEYTYQVYTKPYHELDQLKKYKHIDPSTTYGSELYDAGLIEFAPYTKLDRARAGCFQSRTKFCVAPIVTHSLGSRIIPPTGSFDFFAVGKDCCNCPDQDFRCGSWDQIGSPGGLRMLDSIDDSYYQLAVDQWTAAYRTQAKRPIFLYWTNEPVGNFRGLREMAFVIISFTLLFSLPIYLLLSLIASYIIGRKRLSCGGAE